MKKMIVRIFSLLLFIAALSSPRLITLVSAQSPPPQHPQHHRHGMSMHVRNWMKTPTGSADSTVTPLDPNTVPKFVNQLTRPATFVSVGTKFDRQLGRNDLAQKENEAYRLNEARQREQQEKRIDALRGPRDP